jgi:hypothetical protein
MLSNQQMEAVRSVTLLPVVDLDFPLPFYLIWRKDLPSRSTPGIFREVPADDLLDQFLAEPPGQWPRAQ